jgi:dihydrofolate reductase
MDIHLIAAVSTNNVIGRSGTLPWHIPADLKRFRALTTGHTVIMGRRTYESIGRPLPNRRCLVVSKTLTASPPGVERMSSLADALAANASQRCFIIGGAQLYAEAMPIADVLHLTQVQAHVEGDVYFPDVDWARWTLSSELHGEDAAPLRFTFCTYLRKSTLPKPNG